MFKSGFFVSVSQRIQSCNLWRKGHSVTRTRDLGRCLLAAALIHAVAGCATVKMAAGSDGANIEKILTGRTRAEIETALGPPLFAKGSRQTVYYATYAVDQGRVPTGGDGLLGALIDFMTMGIVGPFIESGQPTHLRPRLVIVYNGDDRAIGLFDAGTKIPVDGRSRSRPQALIKNAGNEGEG